MQKFFTNTIQSNFIKQLIYSTPLPKYKTIAKGDYILGYRDNLTDNNTYKGNFYINKSSVVKCNAEGGTIFTDTESGSTQNNQFEKICDYKFGIYYPQFTEKYASKYNYYDSSTHEYLGKYLRCMRDIYDIDLMPFYNCYSGRNNGNYKITRSGLQEIKDTSIKVYQIPIKFNKTYTIAIDSGSEIAIMPALINNYKLLDVNISQSSDNNINYLLKDYIKFYSNSRFKNPFTFRIGLDDKKNKTSTKDRFKISEKYLLDAYEDKLVLFIQVSALNNSSLVVLEGDYINTARQIVDWTGIKGNYTYIEKGETKIAPPLTNQDLNKICLNNLSLLSFSDTIRHPYANRLIEYLLLNTISNIDEIDENIVYVQDKMGFFKDIQNEESYKGIWDKYLRYKVYDYYMNNKKTINQDTIGYVDSNIEKVLRGQV